MLIKGFTTTLAAIAIAFSSFSAAPAQAGDDTAKIIAGVAALAIIGAAIADNRNNRHVSRHYGYNYNNPHYYGHNYHQRHYHGHKRKVYRHHHYKKHSYRHKHHRKHW